LQETLGRVRQNHNGFSGLTDREVLTLAQADNDDAVEFLLAKYKNYVKIKASLYFLVGADKDDLIQEGMIGLYKAIRDFRHNRGASFHGFADLCITRQIITAIKTATRQKHIPLNSYVSLNKPMYYEEGNDCTLTEALCNTEVADPADLVIVSEEIQAVRSSSIEILSDLEFQVLSLYQDGKSYKEIAEALKRHIKSVDNALQRVKRKVERALRPKRYSHSGGD